MPPQDVPAATTGETSTNNITRNNNTNTNTNTRSKTMNHESVKEGLVGETAPLLANKEVPAVSSRRIPEEESNNNNDDDDDDIPFAISERKSRLAHARRLLYLSHLFAKFSSVAWQFCLVLFLASITRYENLILVSTYGLLSGLVVCLTGSQTGAFIDAHNRLYVTRIFIWTMNSCVLAATVCCYLLLLPSSPRTVMTTTTNGVTQTGREEGQEVAADSGTTTAAAAAASSSSSSSSWFQSRLENVPLDTLSLCLLLAVHIFGPVAALLDRGFTVAIERDWIVVMSQLATSSVDFVEAGGQQQRHQQQQQQHQQQQKRGDNDYDFETAGEKGDDEMLFSSSASLSLSSNGEQRNGSQKGGVVTTTTAIPHPSNTTNTNTNNKINPDVKKWLSETNVAMKQIDLSCKVVAPAAAGFFVAAFDDPNDETSPPGSDLRGAALLVGALNAASIVVEYYCTARVYDLIPDLAVKPFVGGKQGGEGGRANVGKKKQTEAQSGVGGSTSISATMKNNGVAHKEDESLLRRSSGADGLDCEAVETGVVPTEEAASYTIMEIGNNGSERNGGVVSSERHVNSRMDEKDDDRATIRGCGFCKLPMALNIYFRQPISWGGMALALLYLNILTFGAIMTAYLVWRGMRLETIGVWRGVSSAVGLMGTFVYHISVTHLSLESTGMWSIIFQFACLTVSYASLFVQDYDLSLSMLIAGVCLSRVGLWVFDIAITQLMQQLIPESVRGVVGGVQESFHAFFTLMTFVLGITFSDPRQFHVLVAAGYGSVGFAMVFYAFGVFARREKFRNE